MESNRSLIYSGRLGLIGKSITRIINVIWNYVFKGLIGTTLLVGIQVRLFQLVRHNPRSVMSNSFVFSLSWCF